VRSFPLAPAPALLSFVFSFLLRRHSGFLVFGSFSRCSDSGQQPRAVLEEQTRGRRLLDRRLDMGISAKLVSASPWCVASAADLISQNDEGRPMMWAENSECILFALENVVE